MLHKTPVPVEVALEAAELEVAPVARVKRSRLAFGLAVTLAALPVIVLDNLPATAETNEAHVQVQATAADESSSSEPSTTVTTAPTSTTTAAPTTTVTIALETATTEAPVVQALRAPAPTAAAAPAPAPPAATPRRSGGADPNDPATWDRLAQCESVGNWSLNSGNGYYGGLQFSLDTWRNVGGAGYPHEASKAEQINRGKILQAQAGWGQWPYCAQRLGYT